jgi:hypothetical protein
LDTFAGSSSGCVESFSKLRVDIIEVDIIEFFENVITVGFEKIGCDSSANFIGVGLNSGLFKDLISVSLLSLVMVASFLGVLGPCRLAPSGQRSLLGSSPM